jgi:hypothetical protein
MLPAQPMRFILAIGLLGAMLSLLSHPPMLTMGSGEAAFVGWDLTRAIAPAIRPQARASE